MTSDAERRHFSRVSFHGPSILTQGESTWECELLDISINGLLVIPPPAFQVDKDLPLKASVPLSDAAVIEMEVVVARHDPEHLGMTCTNIDVESIAHLRRLVELNLGDANAAERGVG